MENPFKKVTAYEADYNDFDKLVHEVWPASAHKPNPNSTGRWDKFIEGYRFVADMEANNDSIIDFTAEDGPCEEWDQEELDEFILTGKGDRIAGVLLNALCRVGMIPSGKYLIRVCW